MSMEETGFPAGRWQNIYTKSEDLWALLAARTAFCFRPLAGKRRRTDPITLPFPVRREQLYFSVVALSDSSGPVSGLDPLLLFVVLALHGLCSAGFQEHCELQGRAGDVGPVLLFWQTPTNETGLCAPKHSKGRQRWWAPSLHHWNGNFSTAVKLGNKSPTDSDCLWLGHGFVDLTSTQRYKKRWTLPQESGTWNALHHSKYWFGNLAQAKLILIHSSAQQ